MKETITILRLDHRKERDKRITTHVALAARAFGAEGFVYSGERDEKIEESVRKVSENWGGKFSIRHEKKPLGFAKKFPGEKVHLTFYGTPLKEFLGEKKAASKKLLLIVGGPKVPREYYGLGKNVSVTNQPHSEVSAVAVFLASLNEKWDLIRFPNWKRQIVPSERGKVVKSKGKART
ncbi:MAG: tRNA (cytidine(56)-2'-O)-methyltransferase [archaeon]